MLFLGVSGGFEPVSSWFGVLSWSVVPWSPWKCYSYVGYMVSLCVKCVTIPWRSGLRQFGVEWWGSNL